MAERQSKGIQRNKSQLKDNRIRTIDEINKALQNKNLSAAQRAAYHKLKKTLLEKERANKNKDKAEKLERVRKQTELKRKTKERHQNKTGSTNPIRKLTYNKISHRVSKMMSSSTMAVYTSRLAHLISKGWGESNVPLDLIASNKFLNSTNKIYSSDTVKMPLAIVAYGEQLPIGWLDDIRADLGVLQNSYNVSQHKQLKISLNQTIDAKWSDLSFSDNKRLNNDYKRAVINGNSDSRDEVLRTYTWLQDIEIENQDSLWQTRVFLELCVSGGPSGETAELLRRSYEQLIKRLKILQLKTKDMYLTVQNYYDSFGPIGHNRRKGPQSRLAKKYPAVPRSGEMIIAGTSLRQGSISDFEGVPIGIDVNSERPIFIDYTDNNLPPSTIVSATTGSGKTYLMETILIGFLSDPKRYFPVIIDYKNEYVDLGRSAGMQIISSSPSDGLYYDTMEIPETTGDNKLDARNVDSAISTTDHVFEILLGDKWPKLKHAYEFVRRSLYSKQGVYLDKPETWKNSKGLTYHTFYNEIRRVLSENRAQASEESDINNYKELQKSLSEYFEIDGSKKSYFKQPIRMRDINEHTGVIFALDRKGETGGNSSNDTKLLLTMQFILHILNNLTEGKQDRRLIPIYWEETNQLLLIPNVAAMISSLTTGGRSRGIRNFFITNSPGQIFRAEQESKFSTVDPGIISTIVSNAQSVIIGPNSKEDMDTLGKRYNLRGETLQVYMDLLAKQATEDNSDNSAMAHKFIVRHRGKATLIQAISNEALNRLGFFGSEVDVNNNLDNSQRKDALMKELMSGNINANENNEIRENRNKIDNLVSNGSQGNIQAGLRKNQLSNRDKRKINKAGLRNDLANQNRTNNNQSNGIQRNFDRNNDFNQSRYNQNMGGQNRFNQNNFRQANNEIDAYKQGLREGYGQGYFDSANSNPTNSKNKNLNRNRNKR